MAIITYRPTGNSSSGGGNYGTLFGDTNYYLCVDEASSDGDTTYVEAPSGEVARLRCTITNTLTTETINNITIYAVAKYISGRFASADLTLLLYLPAPTNLGLSNSSPFILTTSYALYSFSSSTRPGGGAWTISDLNNLVIGAAAYNDLAGTPRITQMYVEVDYTANTPSTSVKSANGLLKASVKSINGLAIASIKSNNGLV